MAIPLRTGYPDCDPLNPLNPRELAESDHDLMVRFLSDLDDGKLSGAREALGVMVRRPEAAQMLWKRFSSLRQENLKLREFETKWNAAMELMAAIGRPK